MSDVLRVDTYHLVRCTVLVLVPEFGLSTGMSDPRGALELAVAAVTVTN